MNARVDELVDGLVDETAFAELAERHRRELQVHCYRMLGSMTDAEDLVQETFLRAWRRRETYGARSTVRAWLYRIATNACLDVLDRRPREPLPTGPAPADPTATPLPAVAFPWLTPCPDRLLDDVVVSRETIELAFLTALQVLPARQRAALVLRDVLGWPAKEVAELLATTVASANSALQRARETMRAQLPARRLDWAPRSAPTEEEQAVVRRYMAALESADDAAIGAMLAADARCSQAPGAGGNASGLPVWYEGREALLAGWAPALHGPHRVEFRCVPLTANLEPAIACYVRLPGGTAYEAFGLTVLRVAGGRIAELTCFGNEVYPLFGLPLTREP